MGREGVRWLFSRLSLPPAPSLHEPHVRSSQRCVGCMALGTPGNLPQHQVMLSGWMRPLQEGWGWCQRGAWHHPACQGTALLPAPPPAGTCCSPLMHRFKRGGNSIVVRGKQELQSPLRQKQISPLLPFIFHLCCWEVTVGQSSSHSPL